jgi:hypothetical protein
MLRYLQLSEHKVNPKKMTIVILAIWIEIILAVYLPMSAFSQLPFLPDSQSSANSGHRTTHSNNKNSSKIQSSEGTSSSSLNKVTNTSKPNLSTPQVKPTEVTRNLSQKGVDKFGIKEMYPTKKGGREWYVNMTNPRSDNNIIIIAID